MFIPPGRYHAHVPAVHLQQKKVLYITVSKKEYLKLIKKICIICADVDFLNFF